MYYKLTINDNVVDSDILIYDIHNKNKILFVSFVAPESTMKIVNSAVKSKTHISAYFGTLRFDDKKFYETIKYKDEATGLIRQIFYYKNSDQNDLWINLYLFCKDEIHLKDVLYESLDKYTSIPLIPEWKDYLYSRLGSSMRLNYSRYNNDMYNRNCPVKCYTFHTPESTIYDIISNGLKSRDISINGANHESEKIQEVTGLDSYLTGYGDILAEKIKNSFVPRFVPGEDSFCQKLVDFDDVCYSEGTSLFYAQKCAMQSAINTLNEKRSVFIIGEQGSGKTIMSLGVCYSHAKRDGFNTFVMCPAHLVNKWKREVEKFVPNGVAYIVKNISDIKAIDHIIRNKNKKENVFIIISKETAKLDTEQRPSVLYSLSKKCYICPQCGKPIIKQEIEKDWQGRKYKADKKLDFTDFIKPNRHSTVCPHCENKLWTIIGKHNDGWIKLGADGWFHEKQINNIFTMLSEKSERSKQENKMLAALSAYKRNPKNFRQPDYTRYPLAKYIHRYYKGCVNYAIGDELHLYNGDSAQGEAFGLLSSAADKTIGLTGTLLNGYADGLFYTLFRTMPDALKYEGFEYENKDAFNRAYGVIKNVYNQTESNQNHTITTKTITKKLPGISPLVFTKFLLENAVFINLSDMLDGLPNYSEHPIGVEMDNELSEKYSEIENDFSEQIGKHGVYKMQGTMSKTLSAYPDMPYNFEPVLHPENNNVLFNIPDIADKDSLRNKEIEFLRIVMDKHNKGEKILVYYHWTNIIELDNRLKNLLEKNNLKVAIMKSSVNAQKREEWIKDKIENENIDVLLCNPSLVETGLDLLYFTTIIFYEIGFNLYTMRQASRRSWRLGQNKDIDVYYLYYNRTFQEQALALMATKLQASMAIEGKFSEEGLQALSNNEDMLTQIANNIVNGIRNKVDENCFKKIDTTIYHRDKNNIFDDILVDDLISEEDNVIISNIIKEQPRLVRKTRYEVEGKRYIKNYWNGSNNTNILNIINSHENVRELLLAEGM